MVRRWQLAAGAITAAVAGTVLVAAQEGKCEFTKEGWKNCVSHEWRTDRTLRLFKSEHLKKWHKGFVYAKWKDGETCNNTKLAGETAFAVAKRSHAILEGSSEHPRGEYGLSSLGGSRKPRGDRSTRTGRTTTTADSASS